MNQKKKTYTQKFNDICSLSYEPAMQASKYGETQIKTKVENITALLKTKTVKMYCFTMKIRAVNSGSSELNTMQYILQHHWLMMVHYSSYKFCDDMY